MHLSSFSRIGKIISGLVIIAFFFISLKSLFEVLVNMKNIKIKKELNDDEALFSNQKIKDVLGFKEQHNWKKYL